MYTVTEIQCSAEALHCKAVGGNRQENRYAD